MWPIKEKKIAVRIRRYGSLITSSPLMLCKLALFFGGNQSGLREGNVILAKALKSLHVSFM